jgi:hypothetical protein
LGPHLPPAAFPFLAGSLLTLLAEADKARNDSALDRGSDVESPEGRGVTNTTELQLSSTFYSLFSCDRNISSFLLPFTWIPAVDRFPGAAYCFVLARGLVIEPSRATQVLGGTAIGPGQQYHSCEFFAAAPTHSRCLQARMAMARNQRLLPPI